MDRLLGVRIAATVAALIAPVAAARAAVQPSLVQADAGAAAGEVMCNPGMMRPYAAAAAIALAVAFAAAAVVLASAAAATATPALPYAHAAEPQQPPPLPPPMPHVFNATGTVTAEGYAQGGTVPVHGIQVCAYDLTADGTANGTADGTAAAIALSPLNITKGAPACAYTDRGGAYVIPGVVGSDPHDETRADVVVSVVSRGSGGAVSVVGHEAGEYRLYRADSGVAADYNGTLHVADFELGSAANRSYSHSPPSSDAGAAGAARIVSALSDGLSFFEEFGRAPGDLEVWWQHRGGSGEFPGEAGGDGGRGIYLPDAAVLRLGGGGSEATGDAEARDDSRSRWAILSGLARHVHDAHNPGLGLHHCRGGYDARQIGDKQGAACAWVEGWASLAPHLIDGRAAMAGPHGYEIDIEAAADAPWTADGNGRPFAAFEAGVRATGRGEGVSWIVDGAKTFWSLAGSRAVGEKVPGRVAAAMWDMADGAVDPVHDAQAAGDPAAGSSVYNLPRRAVGDSAPQAAAGGRDDVAAGTGRLLGVFFNGTYGSFAEFYDRWEIDMRNHSAERVAMLHGMSFAVPNTVPYYEPVGRLGGLFGSGLAGLELVPNNVAVSADGSIVAVTSERGRGLQLVNVSGGGIGDGAGGGIGRHIGLYAARGHDYSCMLERDRDACMENPATFGPAGPAPGQFSSMDGVAFSPDGETLIVSDGQWNRISMFGPDGAYTGHFGTPHLTAGPAGGPADLPLEGDGEFYCSYLGAMRPDLRELGYRHCGGPGGAGGAPLPAERPVGAGGEFYRLGGASFLPDGTAAAADGGNRRIRLLEIGGDGRSTGAAAAGARIAGQFASYSPDLLAPFTAQHIAASPFGNIYAAGSTIPGLWRYGHANIGGGALLVNDLSLGAPGGIAAGVDGLVYVSDRENGRIRAYDIDEVYSESVIKDRDGNYLPIRDYGRDYAPGAPWAYASGPYDPLGLRPVAAAEGQRAPRAASSSAAAAGGGPVPLPAAEAPPPAGPFPSHLGALPLEVRVVPPRMGAFIEEFGSPGSGPLQLAGPGGIALGWLPGPSAFEYNPPEDLDGTAPPGRPYNATGGHQAYVDVYGPLICAWHPMSQCTDMRVYVADPNGVIIYERDRERPAVTRVWAHTPDGTVRPGGTAEIAVSFSERVTVLGKPVLPLVAGNESAQGAVYASGSGSHTLTFNYTAGAGDGPGYLDNAGAGSLELARGAEWLLGEVLIMDDDGNVELALPENGTGAPLDLAAQDVESCEYYWILGRCLDALFELDRERGWIRDGSGNGADPALPENGTAASLAANAALWIAPDAGRENGSGGGACAQVDPSA